MYVSSLNFYFLTGIRNFKIAERKVQTTKSPTLSINTEKAPWIMNYNVPENRTGAILHQKIHKNNQKAVTDLNIFHDFMDFHKISILISMML